MQKTILFVLFITILISCAKATTVTNICVNLVGNNRRDITLDEEIALDPSEIEDITCDVVLRNGAKLTIKGNVQLNGGRIRQASGTSKVFIEGSLEILQTFSNPADEVLDAVQVRITGNVINCAEAPVSSPVFFDGFPTDPQVWKGILNDVYINNLQVSVESCPSTVTKGINTAAPSPVNAVARRLFLRGNTLVLNTELKLKGNSAEILGTAEQNNLIRGTGCITVEGNPVRVKTEGSGLATIQMRVYLKIAAGFRLRIETANIVVTKAVTADGELEHANSARITTIRGDLTVGAGGEVSSGSVLLRGNFENNASGNKVNTKLFFEGRSLQIWKGNVTGEVYIDNSDVFIDCDSPYAVTIRSLFLRGNTLKFACDLKFTSNGGSIYGKPEETSVLSPVLPLGFSSTPKVIIDSSNTVFLRTEGGEGSVVVIRTNLDIDDRFRLVRTNLEVKGDLTVNNDELSQDNSKTTVEGDITVLGQINGGEVVAKGDVIGGFSATLILSGSGLKDIEGSFNNVELTSDQRISTPSGTAKKRAVSTKIQDLLLNDNVLTLDSGDLAIETEFSTSGTIDNSGSITLGRSGRNIRVLDRVTINSLDTSGTPQGTVTIANGVGGSGTNLYVLGCVTGPTNNRVVEVGCPAPTPAPAPAP